MFSQNPVLSAKSLLAQPANLLKPRHETVLPRNFNSIYVSLHLAGVPLSAECRVDRRTIRRGARSWISSGAEPGLPLRTVPFDSGALLRVCNICVTSPTA